MSMCDFYINIDCLLQCGLGIKSITNLYSPLLTEIIFHIEAVIPKIQTLPRQMKQIMQLRLTRTIVTYIKEKYLNDQHFKKCTSILVEAVQTSSQMFGEMEKNEIGMFIHLLNACFPKISEGISMAFESDIIKREHFKVLQPHNEIFADDQPINVPGSPHKSPKSRPLSPKKYSPQV
eukprot:UN32548